MTGVGGILFSSLLYDDQFSGQNNNIIGIIGAFFAFLIINWEAMKNN